MLHNSGPFGPNDVPVNMGMPVNMSQMSTPINLGNNIGSLPKMPPQGAQTTAPSYNIPDYSSFGHPPLSMGHPMSPFANYHHLNFQANYGHPNLNLPHETTPSSVQNNMLPMNLNTQSDQEPSLMNYNNFESRRYDVNNAQNTESAGRKTPLNIPQIHTKAFHKRVGMDNSYSQYNSTQECQFHSHDLSKAPEKSLIDSTRRKSLENTVKLIENILINSTPKDKLNHLQSESFSINESVDKHNTRIENLDTESKKEFHSNEALRNQNIRMNNLNDNIGDVERDKSEVKNMKADIYDFSLNLISKGSPKTVAEFKATLKIKDSGTDAKIPRKQDNNQRSIEKPSETELNLTKIIQSEIHCEALRRNLINNNHTIVKDQHKDLSDESDSDSEKEETIADLKKEILDDNAVKVKVEPVWGEGASSPFLKDSNATHRNAIEADAIVIEENGVEEALEAAKKDSKPKTYFECCHCNQLFQHPKRFLIHTKWHTFGMINEKKIVLAKEKELKKTMKREARIIDRLNSKEVKEGAEGDAHPCKDCDKVFSAKSSLKNHRQRYHPTRVRECKICKASVVGWMALRAHMAAHAAGTGYSCTECPKRFKYAHSLAKHKDTHLEKTHGCEQCEKKFGSQALLKMHMKCHERTARGATFRCTYCGKGFFESYNLQVHERTHRNERPFLCEICKTSFGTNSSLKRHLKVSHSTSKPFPCAVCQRCFLSAATRARHAARAHGDPAAFPHQCRLCVRRYAALKELNKHMSKTHGGKKE